MGRRPERHTAQVDSHKNWNKAMSNPSTNKAGRPSTRSYLVYVAVEERLYGQVAGKPFDFRAFSGGGRGSRGDKRSESSFMSMDPRTPMQSHEFGERGGLLPPGMYRVGPTRPNPTLGQANRLESITAHLKYPQRYYKFPGGFYIHGRGKYGSDGCIVPENPDDRRDVQAAIDEIGGGFSLWSVLTLTPPSQSDVLRAMLNPHVA